MTHNNQYHNTREWLTISRLLAKPTEHQPLVSTLQVIKNSTLFPSLVFRYLRLTPSLESKQPTSTSHFPLIPDVGGTIVEIDCDVNESVWSDCDVSESVGSDWGVNLTLTVAGDISGSSSCRSFCAAFFKQIRQVIWPITVMSQSMYHAQLHTVAKKLMKRSRKDVIMFLSYVKYKQSLTFAAFNKIDMQTQVWLLTGTGKPRRLVAAFRVIRTLTILVWENRAINLLDELVYR